jgi:undecaprenyl-diphosphatase
MSLIQAAILGLIQGLSEFIPISSSAHLILASKLMGLNNSMSSEQLTAFIAIIQLGTIVAVLYYFSKEIKEVPVAMIQESLGSNKRKFAEMSDNAKMGWMIFAGTLPIVVLGLSFKKLIEGDATKNPIVIASSLIIFSILLFIADKSAKLKKSNSDIGIKEAIIIGISQSFALIPGASRSGTSITGALFLGMTRESAARFSFLLSIPAIVASGLLQLKGSLAYLNSADAMNLIVASLVAGISGYFSIAFLIKYLKTHNTLIFVIYRIALALFILFFMLK